MKKTFVLNLLATLVLGLLVVAPARAEERPFRLGLNADNWDKQITMASYRDSVKKLGIEFIVWHISPEEFANGSILQIADYCRKNNLQYLFNTELMNYVPNIEEFRSDNGQSYRWDIRPEYLEYLKDDKLFLGVIYDESLFVQNLLGSTFPGTLVQPYYADTRADSPANAFLKIAGKISQINDYYRKYNKRLFLEILFPDSTFVAARGGAVLAVKLLKENYNDYMTMMAESAARQYKKANEDNGLAQELWACVDLWYLDSFPNLSLHNKQKLGRDGGHSPQELKAALEFAYEKGFDAAYVEQANGLIGPAGELTEHGLAVIEFNKKRNSLKRGNWRIPDPNSLVVRRFPSGHPGGSLHALVAEMNSYGSAAYDLKNCTPQNEHFDREFANNPYCRADLAYWLWFAQNSSLKGSEEAEKFESLDDFNSPQKFKGAEKYLDDFEGTTFNSQAFNSKGFFGGTNKERPYNALSGLRQTMFIDHTAPKIEGDVTGYFDFVPEP